MNLLNRIANYFKEWDGIDETAPTMELNINELRYIASMNIERCNLIKKVNHLQNMTNIKQFIEENSVSEGYLSDWYQASVTDAEPIWTDEHIAEVYGDFYMIPKEAVDKLN